jgi:1,4-alpha-glucan branching enzyme
LHSLLLVFRQVKDQPDAANYSARTAARQAGEHIGGITDMLKKRFFKTKDECEVTFEYDGNGAQRAALVGEFNGWEPQLMTKAQKSGSPFRIKVRLPKDGKYQFRYLVDQSNWVNDNEADEYWTNEFGESNSVVNTFTDI